VIEKGDRRIDGEDLTRIIFTYASLDLSKVNDLVRKLEDLINRLERAQSSEPRVVRRESTSVREPVAVVESISDEELPEFMRGNEWIRIIRGRYLS